MLEINIGGVFVPAALVWAVTAFALWGFIDRLLSRLGFYRIVWHRGLFDLAGFVLLWGAISAVAYQLAFSAPVAR
ncbi:MAG: DUF1656 domain-containing protein [Hyphomicrobiales bacterium]|nr:DUF1656 domain-containing protein [Hyphomicrobiales bacterium]